MSYVVAWDNDQTFPITFEGELTQGTVAEGTDRQLKLSFNETMYQNSGSASTVTEVLSQSMTLTPVRGYDGSLLTYAYSMQSTWSGSQTFPITFDMTHTYGSQKVVYHFTENMAQGPYGDIGPPLTYYSTLTPTNVDWLERQEVSCRAWWTTDAASDMTLEMNLTQGVSKTMNYAYSSAMATNFMNGMTLTTSWSFQPRATSTHTTST